MSLFVAVRPDESAVEDLQEAVARAARSPAARELRWQPPALWHVTLAFLGDPDDDVEDEVAERLTSLSSHPRISDVQLSGAGTFGGQVVWIGLAPGPGHDALAGMAARIPPMLRGSGAVADWRPWRAHLTVARARRGAAGPVHDLLAGYAGPPWDVEDVLLIRSTGGPRPTHRVVAAIGMA